MSDKILPESADLSPEQRKKMFIERLEEAADFLPDQWNGKDASEVEIPARYSLADYTDAILRNCGAQSATTEERRKVSFEIFQEIISSRDPTMVKAMSGLDKLWPNQVRLVKEAIE